MNQDLEKGMLDFQDSVYEYLRSIEAMMGTINSQPYNPFLSKSSQLLKQIHQQMTLLEGIKVPNWHVQSKEEIKAETKVEKIGGRKRGNRRRRNNERRITEVHSTYPPPPPPWLNRT